MNRAPTGVIAYLGLGSNLGDRRASLDRAASLLAREPGIRVPRRSGLYETEPVGPPDQPWYLNGVLEIETSLPPRDLLAALKRIEREIGRVPGRRWGERVIDLDLLLYGDRTIDEPDLTVPHRELWRRLFVLVPLAELRPDLRAPDGKGIGAVIEGLAGSAGIRPVDCSAGASEVGRLETVILSAAKDRPKCQPSDADPSLRSG